MHHGQSCREPEGHMKINLPVFKDEDKKNTITYQCWNLTVYCNTGCQGCTLLPYVIHSLLGYPGELVRCSGTDITLDDVLAMLDEHYNNVKALDVLNQELFQLWMGEETVSEWGVHLSRHLQILTASFLESFVPDHIPKVKHYCFYSEMPKQFKAMVAFLKASSNEKMYPDYLWVACEAKKEEVMEPSCNSPTASMSKSTTMSFFPLQRLKGSQPVATPSAWVAHLEEVSTNKEECVNSKDPDGIEGITKEFMFALPGQWKMLSRRRSAVITVASQINFICNFLLVAGSRADLHLNWKERTVPKKGAQAQGKTTMPKVPQDGTPRV